MCTSFGRASALAAVLALSQSALGTLVIQTGQESFTAGAGDAVGSFYAITGGAAPAPFGGVFDGSAGRIAGQIQVKGKGPKEGKRSLTAGKLWSYLHAQDVASADGLVFGFGLKGGKSGSSDSLTISELTINLKLPGGGSQTFDLMGQTVQVYDYARNGRAAEALFFVDLQGMDFMQTFSARSKEKISITTGFEHTSREFKMFFLGAGFTVPPQTSPEIPEPASLGALGAGGLLMLRRRRA